MDESNVTTITFQDENRPLYSMEMTRSLSRAIVIASGVNVGDAEYRVSFDTLLIGLLATPGATGSWLRSQFERTKAALDGLLRRHGFSVEQLDQLPVRIPWIDTGILTRTASARTALDEAERIARDGSQTTDTTHVLSAILSLPGYHDSDFRALRIDRGAWQAAWNEYLPTAAAQQDNAALELATEQRASGHLDFTTTGLDSNVLTALQVANALAGSSLISPANVVIAILQLATSASSNDFKRFAQLVPLSIPNTSPVPGAPPDAARFEDGLLTQLVRAQRPAAGSTLPCAIWGRDLIAAALLCNADTLRPAVSGGTRSVEAIRDLWYEYVTSDPQHRTASDWIAWWLEAGVALPGPRRSGYATETDLGDDKLGVDAEARAFARLILDRDVHAPLSIGLLGDWGSGKSFFIEQIKKEIAALKNEGRPELYARVVEIEFNAWHASDSNLWASLVTNIFDEIWQNVSPADQTRDPKVARERLKKQIAEARGAMHEAETQIQISQDALQMAEENLQQKREILAWNKYVTSMTVDKLRALAKAAGWHESIETINDVERAARSLSVSSDRLRAVGSALIERPLLRIALPTGLLLATTAAAWLLVNMSSLQGWSANLAKLLATVAGVASTLIAPLRLAKTKVNGLANTLQTIQQEYDRNLAVEKTRNSAETAEVERARRELESTEASVNTARARLGELLSQQASLDPRRRLGAFLQERVQTTQYRSQQGIISLVHKDFSELSKYMKDLRESAAKNGEQAEEEDAIRPFDRIVLYVDDLDRCRPAHVVNMLEAVHLLLALDLFVVVVAVDSRWLTRALEVYYHDLLSTADGKDSDGLRASTPQSYLEKIFQITYALGPMNPATFGNYVSFLTGEEAEKKEQEEARVKSTSGGAQTTILAPAAQQNGAATNVATTTQTAGAQRAGAAADAAATQPVVAKPERPPSLPVRIGKDEREFIGRLVPLLPTPRIAKRLVNVYRVIKSSKSVEELDAFEREGRTRACLLMLAILFGRPALAAELLRALHEQQAPFDQPDELFVSALRRRKAPDGESLATRDSWAKLITTLDAIGIDDTVSAFASEPREVARYSLASGHDWHTWNSPAASPPLAVIHA